jgi:hypothetical protein
LVFQVASLLQNFNQKPLSISLSLYVPHALPISFFLIWSPEKYLKNNTNDEAPHGGFNTNLLLTPPVCPNIFLGILFSKALGLCFSLSVGDEVSDPYKQEIN